MRISIFLFVIFLTLSRANGQGNIVDSASVDLFNLYENSVDQEGMFYLPVLKKKIKSTTPAAEIEKRLQVAIKNGNHRVAANLSTHLAWNSFEEESKENTLRYFEVAISQWRNAGNPKAEAIVFLYKGFVNYQILEYDNALQDFLKANQILIDQKIPVAEAVSHALIGQVYLVKKDFDQANIHFIKASDLFKEQGNNHAKARIDVQIAEIAIRKLRHQDAKKILLTVLSHFKTANDNNGQALVYRDLGIISFKEGNYDDAASMFRTSLDFSDQLSAARLLKNTYLKLFTIYSLRGEHDKSNSINITYVQLRDSIDQTERSRILNSQLTRRDLLEKETIDEMLRREDEISYHQLSKTELERNRQITEAEIERLEKEKIIEDLNIAKQLSDQASMERDMQIQLLSREKELQDLALSRKELEISRQETLRNTLLTTVLFIIVIAAMLFNRYRNQKKSNEEINKAYRELSETHTRLVAAQEQLAHAQKMASLGQLTAGIAHEIQNPLNFVNNFSELSAELIDELRQPEANKEAILNDLTLNMQKINLHGKRADKIVKGMLLHSRNGEQEMQYADINLLIEELLDLSYHGNKNRKNGFTAEIVNDFADLPEVKVSMNDFSRVLINLFNNSFYALAEKSAKAGPDFKPQIKVSTRQFDNIIEIRVSDNGTGIPDAVLKKIFDPFFTTKPAGEGTGLGLSLSYDIIVKGHHGNLSVDSKENEYTEFNIQLPVT
jgi:two-component system, NtrC family, sensor kinase